MHAALAAGLPAVALLDRDGVYGAPRFFGIAHENKFTVRPRVGAEITMEDGACFATWAELERFSEGLVALTADPTQKPPASR